MHWAAVMGQWECMMHGSLMARNLNCKLGCPASGGGERERMKQRLTVETDSLAISSDAIQANTTGQLNDQHQLALSQAATVITQCEVYQSEQLAARKFFENMGVISSEYEQKLENVTNSLHDKQNHLTTLWKQWEELNDGIRGLCGQAMAVRPEIPSDRSGDSGLEGEGAAVDEGYLNGMFETLNDVKDKWVTKMEDSEKVGLSGNLLTLMKANRDRNRI